MSRVNPLPPQAFTKETLHKAYLWLNAQGPHIKELATTPELLVSLFLKAQRNGEESLNRPSIQNFKNELKSLAGMIGEFESGTSSSNHQQDLPSSANERNSNQNSESSTANPAEALYFASQNMEPNYSAAPNSHFAPSRPQENFQLSNTNTSAPISGIDQRSFAMIQEVKNQFNLSTETEALRLLISLGYSKAKTIL